MALKFGKIIRLSNLFKALNSISHSPFVCAIKHFSNLQSNLNNLIEKHYTSENAFAHGVLENNNRYSEMVFDHVKKYERVDCDFTDSLVKVDWLSLPVSEVVTKFEEISQFANLPITNPACLNLLTALNNQCFIMTDEQLVIVLKSLRFWPFPQSKDPGYLELINALDKVCLSRWKKWKLNQIFLFMELWYHLQLSKKSTFVFKAAMKFMDQPHRLSKEHVVLLLFHLNLLRTATRNTSMFEIETRLAEVAEELTFNELSIALMGFFKGEKSLYNEKLMNTAINKLLQEMKTASDIPFTSVIKNLRKSLPVSLWPKAVEVADAVNEELPRLSLASAVHAALFTTRPQLQHPPLLNGVASKLLTNITQARIKDMEKAMFPFAQLSYDPPELPSIYAAILEELEKPERLKEIETYPKSFVALIHYFCLKGVYFEKWIKKVLDKEFIHHTYGKNRFSFGRELLFVDCCVDLECPQYDGPRLDPEIRAYLAKRYSEFLPDPNRKLSRHQLWQYDVTQTAEVLFGKDYISQKYLLPHHPKADIVVHLGDKLTPLPLSECLRVKEETFGHILKAPGPRYFAIVTASQNMFLYESKLLNGESNAKVKHLNLIGYIPVLVPFDTWPRGSTIEKVEHLRNIIQHVGDGTTAESAKASL